MSKFFTLLCGAAMLLAASGARAVTIDFVPAAQTVTLGTAAQVDVVVSGLGDGVAPSLGAFDIDVAFDDTVLAFDQVVLGADLGDPDSILETVSGAGLLGPGLIDAFVVSFLLDFELDALQGDSVVIASLLFDTVGIGTSALTLPQVLLGDALGVPLALDAPAGSGSIQVAAASALPATGTFALLAAALALALARVRRT